MFVDLELEELSVITLCIMSENVRLIHSYSVSNLDISLKKPICAKFSEFFLSCDLDTTTQHWTRNFPVKIPQLDALVQVSLLVHIGTMIFQISESPDSSLPPRTKEIIIYTAIQEFEEKLDIY